MHKIVSTPLAPVPIGPYSQAVVSSGFLYSSGQIALDPATGIFANGTIEEETAIVMANIKAVLEAENLDFSAIVSTNIYLKNMDDFAVVNEVYSRYFNGNFPARTTIEVSRLPKNAHVEISFIAATRS